MTTSPHPKFWMVYHEGHHAPTYKHVSLSSAKTEAARLAREHPGTELIILEAVGVAKSVHIVLDEFEDIPF